MAQAAAAYCATHSQTVARFQCDGCGKLLCDACIEESHRLLLCRLCGERALPLAADAPATTVERKQLARPGAALSVPWLRPVPLHRRVGFGGGRHLPGAVRVRLLPHRAVDRLDVAD